MASPLNLEIEWLSKLSVRLKTGEPMAEHDMKAYADALAESVEILKIYAKNRKKKSK